jgi:hypothetical protein
MGHAPLVEALLKPEKKYQSTNDKYQIKGPITKVKFQNALNFVIR